MPPKHQLLSIRADAPPFPIRHSTTQIPDLTQDCSPERTEEYQEEKRGPFIHPDIIQKLKQSQERKEVQKNKPEQEENSKGGPRDDYDDDPDDEKGDRRD